MLNERRKWLIKPFMRHGKLQWICTSMLLWINEFILLEITKICYDMYKNCCAIYQNIQLSVSIWIYIYSHCISLTSFSLLITQLAPQVYLLLQKSTSNINLKNLRGFWVHGHIGEGGAKFRECFIFNNTYLIFHYIEIEIFVTNF